jgi:gamma-glutamylcyclotransferase (GGCT)/AIG2-like uncharacterized protein YtfP
MPVKVDLFNELDGTSCMITELCVTDLLAASPHRRLFVYGTLMSNAVSDYGQAARDRLVLEAPSRMAAHTCGLLYELGRYPGLVVNGSTTTVVHGQLLLLADELVTLPWLDDYEAISSAPGADNEYARQLRTVVVPGGTVIAAWVYVYIKPVNGLIPIANGRWR